MENNIYEKLEKIEKLLNAQTLLQKPVLDVNEAAEYLSFSKSHLYKLTSKQLIPYSCPQGKRLYFRREELDDWMLRNKVDVIDSMTNRDSDYLLKNPMQF